METTSLNRFSTTLTELSTPARAGAIDAGTARLQGMVATYRTQLGRIDRTKKPLEWALAQNGLGNALRLLGERERDPARLEEALATYREALTEARRDRHPLDWAMIQNNLGVALRTLGLRETGTGMLHEAVAAYREALK